MSRYTGPVCRLCRREGTKLYLKGDRCYTAKCSLGRRPVVPGQHGKSRKKLSEYGIQLREKQKAKRIYGMREDQFFIYYEIADRMKGITGENLLQLLERRLDNVVFRIGFGASRPQSRQLVRHGHILVNGKRVDIPSYLVEKGDIIAVDVKSADEIEIFRSFKEASARAVVPWLQVAREKLEGYVIAMPARADVDLPIDEHLIVEHYSR